MSQDVSDMVIYWYFYLNKLLYIGWKYLEWIWSIWTNKDRDHKKVFIKIARTYAIIIKFKQLTRCCEYPIK